MSKPAARLYDAQVCPKPKHRGGPIVEASPDVDINNRAAARMGDPALCVGVGSKTKISSGSATVFINGKRAARLGDKTDHSGRISMGSSDSFIGEVGNDCTCSPAAQKAAMIAAKKSGRPFCAVCNCS